MALSRRAFLQHSATAAVAAGFLSNAQLYADPLGLPLGCQTWPVRDLIEKDFPGTLKTLQGIGFRSIEMCSPVGYAHDGFGGLAKYKGSELKKIIHDAGLTCISSHFGIAELREKQEDRIAWAKDLGLTQMLVPSLDGPEHPTMDDVKKAADEYNKMAAKAAKAGIQQGLHAEGFETAKVDGKFVHDILLELLDPKLVKFQFQVSNIEQGLDAADYFTRYPGRFISMHVQGWDDKTKKIAAVGQGTLDWKKIVAVGQGTLDWKKIFAAAKVGGIKNYFVEMDLPLMKESVPYLHKLKV